MVEDDWLWGWDPTPGIVSVWAEPGGRAIVWRRLAGELIREDVRFRPWAIVERTDGLPRDAAVTELGGDGALRYLVRGVELARRDGVLVLAPDEQYLVASGRTYFRDLPFDDLRRMQFDLETTGPRSRDRSHLHDRDPRARRAQSRARGRRA